MQPATRSTFPLNGKRRRSIERYIPRSSCGPDKLQLDHRLSKPKSDDDIAATNVPRTLSEDAKTYLVGLAGEKRGEANTLGWFRHVAAVIRRTSRSRHVRAVASAHAIALQLEDDADRDLVLEDLQGLVGRRIAGRTRDLHLIVEHVVGYGADNAADLAAARRLISRDVKAIEHLREKKVRPSQVEALARKKDEGLDHWSRRAAERKRTTETAKTEALSPQQEEHERSLRHVLLHVVRNVDGTEVNREKIVLTAVLAGEVAGAFGRLKKLGK